MNHNIYHKNCQLKLKNMKNLLMPFSFLLSLLLLPGCEFIGDVFKTGLWVGIIIVIAIIVIIALIARIFSK